MRERPILFSALMVRAILEGRKSQTRRVVTAPKEATLFGRTPEWDRAWVDPGPSPAGNPGPYLKLPVVGGDLGGDEIVRRIYPRFFVGDRLWVRETWGRVTGNGIRVVYRDDADPPLSLHGDPIEFMKWTPSIFMPRWASRITLEVTAVRIERVQGITKEDSFAEGTPCWSCGHPLTRSGFPDCACYSGGDAVASFRALWDQINGKRPGCSWQDNPWVWVYEFRRVEEAERSAAK